MLSKPSNTGSADVTLGAAELNLRSVGIPIVMLGSDLRIRRFTPAAGKVLNLLPGDVGRPVGDLRPAVALPDLDRLLADVMDTVQVQEREVRGQDGRWYARAAHR